eukprot:TRINITY_DN2462_c0_g1_i10.p2 TRINITY_DN2462_c0_g1~~TRINITY_DN2462_c0_g1_i10.p2  ORF type:complete len:478 (+),score=67.42 TRINITY_DN2462_c0_g1_i10:1913-3346(+)
MGGAARLLRALALGLACTRLASASAVAVGIAAPGLATRTRHRQGPHEAGPLALGYTAGEAVSSVQQGFANSLALQAVDVQGGGLSRHVKAKRNILILMSDTGGGHRASAEALSAALNTLYPGQLNISIVDMWTKYGVWPYNRLVQTYRFLGRRPLLWRIAYDLGRIPLFRRLQEAWCGLLCFAGVKRCLTENKPDLIVSVHPLCQTLPLRVLKSMGGGTRRVPFVTVVTDLASAHPTWFHRGVDAAYVPTEALRRMACRQGLKPEQVRLTGLPIRPEFWCTGAPPTKAKARARLGLLHAAPTAVIVGGGDGVGRLSEIAHSVADQLSADMPLSQLVVVCGRNEAVRAALQARPWPPNVQVTVLGFIPHLDMYMAAADVLVTKAGPGTIAEACALGVPLILSSFLPGQESGNVPFVTEGGFGTYEHRPRGIAHAVSALLLDPPRLQEMGRKARSAGRPRATLDIAADLVQTMLPPVRQ